MRAMDNDLKHWRSVRHNVSERDSSIPRYSEDKDSGQPVRFITLLTDFGLDDIYVGAMKGVIASINPMARVVDLCHGIEPQDVRAAAFMLAGSFGYFPPGTIHVAVVDPTVGSERPALCVQAGEYFFVGPDNGIISAACCRAGRPKIFHLENEEYFLKNPSRTFHGRDIFAPAAAHLSAGVPIDSMGPRARSMKRIRFPEPLLRRGTGSERSIAGKVVHVDRFGNLITNIEPDSVGSVFPRTPRCRLLVTCGKQVIQGLSETYSEAASGMPLALFGSYGLMEISIRDGDAATSLGVGRGGRVEILPASRRRR